MKHGPIALIDRRHARRCFRRAAATRCTTRRLSNIEEIRARKGPIIAVATEGDDESAKLVDDVFTCLPRWSQSIPLLTVIPLQLLAYHIAVARGCDVDKPRNLAKSVTVE